MDPIKLDYKEPDLSTPPQEKRLEELNGTFPYVTSAPTWMPKTFRDSMAIYTNGATYRLYIYDYVNNAWRYAALT